jgi:hypothetical protein
VARPVHEDIRISLIPGSSSAINTFIFTSALSASLPVADYRARAIPGKKNLFNTPILFNINLFRLVPGTGIMRTEWREYPTGIFGLNRELQLKH